MKRSTLRWTTALAFSLASLPAVAQAGGNVPGDSVYDASLKAITILLVVAVLLESALAVIFNWRVFRAYFSVAGLKTLISFVVSLFIVQGFGLDIMSRLLSVYEQGDFQSNLGTQILTALIIAGGSSGVNKLLVAFGYRDNSVPEDTTPTPPKDKAWISVRVRKKQARSPVQVHVTEEPRPPAGITAIAGTCLANRPSLISLLMRNNDRFPSNGGYAVTPEKAYRISVSALGSDGSPVAKPVTAEPVMLAAGAIVDFDVVL